MALLLPWGVFSFINSRVLAANAPFLPEPPSAENSPAPTETYNPQWLNTRSTLDDAATQTVLSGFTRITEHGLEDTAADREEALLFNQGGNFETIHLTATKKKKKGAWVFPGFVKKLSLSVQVMLLVGMLLASLKMVSAPKGKKELPKFVVGSFEEPEEPEAEETEEPLSKQTVHFDAPVVRTRVRLEKIKNLVPAATRLAAAIDTEESMRLLREVRQVIKDADDRTAGLKERNEALEESVARALGGLRWLQEAAFRTANELIAAEPSSSEFPAADLWANEETTELVQKLEREAEAPLLGVLLQTCQKLQEGDKELRRQFTEGGKAALAGEKFEDEYDEAALLDTAGALEFLRDTSEARRRFASVAQRMNEDLLSGVKCIMMGNRIGEARAIEGSMAGIALYKKALLNEGFDQDPEKKDLLNYIIKGYGEVDELFERLRPLRKAVRDGTTISGVCTADARAVALEKEAYDWISKCKKAAEGLALPGAPFEGFEREIAIKRGEMAHQLVDVYNIQTLYAVKELRETADKAAAAAATEIDHSANLYLARAHLEEASQLEKEMAERTYNTKLALDALKQTEDLIIAINEMAKMNEYMYIQQEAKTTTQMIKMSSGFLRRISEGVDQAASESLRIGPHIPPAKRLKYKELLKPLNEAKKEFQLSTSLMEAAKAAADVQDGFLAIRDLLLENSKEIVYEV